MMLIKEKKEMRLLTSFLSILLVGERKDTYPVAMHYASFYNIPLLEKELYFYPKRYIMIRETAPLVNDEQEQIFRVNIQDYPHKGKHGNYFISWVKQKYG